MTGPKLRSSELQKLKQENERLKWENAHLFDILEDADELDFSDVDRSLGSIVATMNGKYFHRPDCHWAQEYILSAATHIEFTSHEEAVDAGYKPCETCRA